MSDMRAGIMTLEELGEPGIVRIITAEPGNDGFSQEAWTAYTDAAFLGQVRPVLNAEIEEFVLPEEVLIAIQLPCDINVRCDRQDFTVIYQLLQNAVNAWHQDLAEAKGKGKGKGKADPFFFFGAASARAS